MRGARRKFEPVEVEHPGYDAAAARKTRLLLLLRESTMAGVRAIHIRLSRFVQ